MELHLKKRILGAWLTVTAILVVAPIVLDGSRTHILLESDAPAMPDTERWATEEYERQVRKEWEFGIDSCVGRQMKYICPS